MQRNGTIDKYIGDVHGNLGAPFDIEVFMVQQAVETAQAMEPYWQN